jgi:hypothetical protein
LEYPFLYYTKMKKYIFYIKSDSKKEIIGTAEAKNNDSAIKYFSLVKKLDVDEFKKLFRVEEK